MAATKTELDYRAASYIGDELVLGTWVGANDGRFTMQRAYQLIRVEDNTTIMTATTRFACIDLHSGKVKRMPDRFVDAYRVIV